MRCDHDVERCSHHRHNQKTTLVRDTVILRAFVVAMFDPGSADATLASVRGTSGAAVPFRGHTVPLWQ